MPVPVPQLWDDGEDYTNIPSAADLNLDWRDSFNFLLGYNLPLIYLHSTSSQSLAINTYVTINFQSEMLKRGGMAHATNAATFSVPYDGQYIGFMYGGYASFTTISGKMKLKLLKNGTTAIADANQTPESTSGSELHSSFTADLTAGDTLSMQMMYTGSASSTSATGFTRPRIAAWYAGEFQ